MRARDVEGAALEKVTALFNTEQGKGWDEWEVLEMDVQETIGQPTYGKLVIAATSQNFDFLPMLGKSCVLILSREYDRKRFFKGLSVNVLQDQERRRRDGPGDLTEQDCRSARGWLQARPDQRQGWLRSSVPDTRLVPRDEAVTEQSSR